MRVRRPAVAGSFYPASERELSAMLERLCARAAPPEKAVGAIAPHAGYVFSGGLAGAVWSRVVVPRTVLLLGPNHTGLGAPFAARLCLFDLQKVSTRIRESQSHTLSVWGYPAIVRCWKSSCTIGANRPRLQLP